MLLQRSAKGFTLIELLVVIAIIGILASIVLSALNTARTKGRDSNRASTLNEIGKLMNLYNNEPPTPFTQDAAGTIPCPAHSLLSDCLYMGGTPTGFEKFKDPSGSNTPCPRQSLIAPPSFDACSYSISDRNGQGAPTTQNWQVCSLLENGNAQYVNGTFSYVPNSYGAININSQTGTGVRAGCY